MYFPCYNDCSKVTRIMGLLITYTLLDRAVIAFVSILNFWCCIFIVNQLDGDESTYIHLAIQHGYTSTIEKLVSKGADLNIQSPDGQTCLHKAIKLCYKTKKIVQESDSLRKVSLTPLFTRPTPDTNNKLYIPQNEKLKSICRLRAWSLYGDVTDILL